MKNKTIIIFGGARDFHAMDWYRSVRDNSDNRKILFLTDSIAGEGLKNIIKKGDVVHSLFIVDKFLLSKHSQLGNLWRNVLKLLLLPVQVFLLRRFLKHYPDAIIHAHPMYYMFVCALAYKSFIGTPQGDEILIRPQKSWLYKFFSKKILNKARLVTVDSLAMKQKVKELSGVNALIAQYGIDVKQISQIKRKQTRQNSILSIRGLTDLYRITNIVEARDYFEPNLDLIFTFPYEDVKYRKKLEKKLKPGDLIIGRTEKLKMYEILANTTLVVSIPRSDSSPRSVYESIFLGCCIAVTPNPWIHALSPCMQERLFIVDLNEKLWLKKAYKYAERITSTKYIPSQLAIETFDHEIIMRKFVDLNY